jgi:type IV fimbrial biogenesis protein FimT
MTQSRRHSAGFNLIELMVAIAVLSILVGIGVPSFTTFIRNNRIGTQTNAVIGALNYARGETAVRGQPVSVCAANTTRTACLDGNNWSNGWMIFTDRTGEIGQFDEDDVLLQAGDAPVAGFAVGATGPFVRFGGGFAATTAETFTITPTQPGVCATTGARRIDMAATGRIQSNKVSC